MNRQSVMNTVKIEMAKFGLTITGQWSDRRNNKEDYIGGKLMKFRVYKPECKNWQEIEKILQGIGQKVYAKHGANWVVTSKGYLQYISFRIKPYEEKL